MNGDELYVELEHEGEVSDWVQEHVLPHMTEEKVNRDEARERIAAFCGGAQTVSGGARAAVRHGVFVEALWVGAPARELVCGGLCVDFVCKWRGSRGLPGTQRSSAHQRIGD